MPLFAQEEADEPEQGVIEQTQSTDPVETTNPDASEETTVKDSESSGDTTEETKAATNTAEDISSSKETMDEGHPEESAPGADTSPEVESLENSVDKPAVVPVYVEGMGPESNPVEQSSPAPEDSNSGPAIETYPSVVVNPAVDNVVLESGLQAYSSPVNQVDVYLDAIDDAEVESGAYSMGLADLYLGLGQSLLDEREFDDAKVAFQNGMQVVRVNNGLNSPEQTSYLFSVADIETIQGNTRVADKVLGDIYMINTRHFGAKAPEMLPVLSQILSWYKRNRPPESPINRYADLERSGILTGEMAEIVELDKGLGHPDTTEIYRRQGQIHWHTAKYVLGRGISVEPGVIMATGKPSYSVNVKEVSIKAHFRDGRQAFSKVAQSVALDPNSTAMEHAEAIAQLGDWNLAFGKKQAATSEYERAHKLLAERLRSDSVADEYFKDPVPVRFMEDDLQVLSFGQESEPDIMINASMTITEGGRALNINILDAPEDMPSEQVRMISRELNGMHFRPRLTDGIPSKSRDFIFSFPIDTRHEGT